MKPAMSAEATQLTDEIAANPDGAAHILAGRAGDASGRDEALAAARALAERYLVPAADLLATGDEPGHRYIDLEAAAGVEIPGLVLGLLGREIPSLTDMLPDDYLARILDGLGIEIDGADRRRRFFLLWRAARATRACGAIFDFLANLDPAGLDRRAELALLRELSNLTWPWRERERIRSLIVSLGGDPPS